MGGAIGEIDQANEVLRSIAEEGADKGTETCSPRIHMLLPPLRKGRTNHIFTDPGSVLKHARWRRRSPLTAKPFGGSLHARTPCRIE
jgi:hypothetical protein